LRLVKGKYSSDMLRQYKELKYATETERVWAEQDALRQEATAANWNARKEAVAERMGPEGVALWSQYNAAAKGAERDALKQQNPAVREAIMAGFNPAEYDQVIVLFGPEAWSTYYNTERPAYPEGAGEAELQQYYDALRQWNNANATDAEMRFWINGRPTTGDDWAYDFGDDWEEAKRIFGEEIFDIERASNSAADWKAWRNANPDAHMRLTGYKEWKKVGIEDAASRKELEAEMQYDAAGPRPLGSERRPVGAADWQVGMTTAEIPQLGGHANLQTLQVERHPSLHVADFARASNCSRVAPSCSHARRSLAGGMTIRHMRRSALASAWAPSRPGYHTDPSDRRCGVS
jgi:hypothetical protein